MQWPVLIMGLLLAASYRSADHSALLNLALSALVIWFFVAFAWDIYATWKKRAS